MSQIELQNLTKVFERRNGGIVKAVNDVSIEVETGEFLVLLGPSGCGKTTMLRSIAGLEVPTFGRILVDGKPLFDSEMQIAVAPEKRDMGMIFQSYALWPHLTVQANVAYPLKMRGFPKSEIASKVQETLELVGIGELATQYPGQVSGGQQQRTALARALVGGSGVVLFDEPLSNVDAKVRVQLRLEIRRMHDDLGFTALYVTHDQEEAMALGTRVAIMHAGRVEQVGTPREVYHSPESLTVGRFVGTLNEFEGRIEAKEDGLLKVKSELGELYAPARDDLAPGDEVTIGIRPEDIELLPPYEVTQAPNGWTLAPEMSFFLGPFSTYVFTVEGVELRATQSGARVIEEGIEVGLRIDPEKIYIFPSDSMASPSR